MLFKALIVLQACLLLCQGHFLTRYQSQTVVKLTLQPLDQLQLCKCQDKKCELDQQVADDACKAIIERFRAHVDPSGFMMLCEFQPRTCSEMNQNKPKAFYIDAIFDAHYLRVSSFGLDRNSAGRLVDRIFKRNSTSHPIFTNKPKSISLKIGTGGMPIEFDGTLNISAKEADNYEMCYSTACHKVIDEICGSFGTAMKTALPKLMRHFIGCNVRHIYKVGGTVRAAWSMMFHHHNFMKSGIVKTSEEFKQLINSIKPKVKPDGILVDFNVVGVLPLDFCEIEAWSQTTLRYHPSMQDPTSSKFHIYSRALIQRLIQQLMIGETEQQTCLRRVADTRLENGNGFVRAKTILWVSMTCYKKRGYKKCGDAINHVSKLWKKGSEISYNFYTPKYDFKYFWVNQAFEK